MTMRSNLAIDDRSSSVEVSSTLRAPRAELTARQATILAWVEAFCEQRGYAPTLREIGAAHGIRSTNGVNDHLRALERKGFIERRAMLSRALVIVGNDTLTETRERDIRERDGEGNVRGAWQGEALALRHLLHRVAMAGQRQLVLSAEMVIVLQDVRIVLATIPGGGT